MNNILGRHIQEGNIVLTGPVINKIIQKISSFELSRQKKLLTEINHILNDEKVCFYGKKFLKEFFMIISLILSFENHNLIYKIDDLDEQACNTFLKEAQNFVKSDITNGLKNFLDYLLQVNKIAEQDLNEKKNNYEKEYGNNFNTLKSKILFLLKDEYDSRDYQISKIEELTNFIQSTNTIIKFITYLIYIIENGNS